MNTGRLERILTLLMMIGSGRAMGVDELAEHFDVGRRTVFRDLDILNRAGVKTWYDRSKRRYRIHEGAALQPITVTEDECLALLFLSGKLLETGIWPCAAAANEAASKLEAALPAELRERCTATLAHISLKMVPFSSLEGLEDTFASLQHGLTEQLKIWIVYEPPGRGRIEDYLHPYHIAFMRNGWYVLGHSEVLDEVRAFKVERIFACSLTGQTFAMEHSFDLSEYLGNAWGIDRNELDEEYHVVLEFTPEAADSIEEVRWHKTQATWRTQGDSLILEAQVAGLEDISSWILGHGERVKVIQPAALQTLVRQQALQVVGIYESEELMPSIIRGARVPPKELADLEAEIRALDEFKNLGAPSSLKS